MSNMLFSVVLTIHVVVGLCVIGLVLMQHGKGADAGAAFGGGGGGSGGAGSIFGSSGSANFLSRTTAMLATVFFITSLGLSFLVSNKPAGPTSVMDQAVQVNEGVPTPGVAVVPPTVPQAAEEGEGSRAGAIPQ